MSHDDSTLPSDDRKLFFDSDRIGSFVLRRVIASGAMGTVYEAIQDHPRRTVAIKVMKRGTTSNLALRRFEFEAQLLARLHHPGVAEVYEAGTHDDGSGPVPYFAMEYVPNARSITAFANAKSLDTRARLQLFAQICDAVQHGHQKGIVHRDLKPDNIIVGPGGRPKVIDFGVARATDSDLAFATLQTSVGQLVGTLQYMSPEQVAADPHDIDIRSDVYSLGVILYELLAGSLPYEVSGVSTLEAVRRIRENSPARLASVDRQLAGDIETITHKALEKDRERRYQSAGELGADIRRYLDRQPITARTPTLLYTLKVFTRRNRALVGSLGVVFAVLVAGIVVSTMLYLRAEAERAEAERQSERTLNAIGFVEDMVESANPLWRGEEVKIADLLDRYGKTVSESFPDDPEIEAAVRMSIAECYRFLDLYEKGGQAESYKEAARSHLKKAVALRRQVLGPEHPEVLKTRMTYASLLQHQGRLEEAASIYRDVLAIRSKTRGEGDPSTSSVQVELCSLLQMEGNYDEAERIARKLIENRREEHGDEDPTTLEAMDLLTGVLRGRGELPAAEQLAQTIYATHVRLSGPDTAQTEAARRQLATVLLEERKVDETEALYGDRALPQELGLDHWLQGEGDFAAAPATMIVALESWCPFSAMEMSRLEGIYETYGSRGLAVIGLTRSSTEQKMQEFLRRYGVTFPIAKVTDDVPSELFSSGVPHAVIAKDKSIVWTGHPGEFPPEALESLLAAK